MLLDHGSYSMEHSTIYSSWSRQFLNLSRNLKHNFSGNILANWGTPSCYWFVIEQFIDKYYDVWRESLDWFIDWLIHPSYHPSYWRVTCSFTRTPFLTYVNPSVHSSAHLSIRLFVWTHPLNGQVTCPSVSRAHPSVCKSISLTCSPACLSTHPSIHLSIHPLMRQPDRPSIH